MVNGSPSGCCCGPSTLRFPASPATTAVPSVTTSVPPGSEASQFCTSTHQVPASGSVTSQNSFEPGVVLEQTTAAGLGSEPVPTNRSMSLAVESVSETTNREASSGTSITAV